ncbi:MAG TPA: FecR family protein [Cytophagaceae bacterium]|jgi:transmembrane sensor|nr:FecR family protein [Cytophagaceae bacterium]
MEKNYDHLIVKHLTDQLSEEEKTMLFSWIAESEEHQIYYHDFLTVWEKSSPLNIDYLPDTDASWMVLQKEIEQEQKQSFKMPVFRSAGFYKIAASLVLVIGLAYLIGIAMSSLDRNILRQTAENRDVFYLPDSSMVWLNKNSSLSYTPSFDGKERIVYLKGQAFFDVKKNPDRPFIIHASGTTTKVLGTSFDLKAYDKEDVQLTVVTGKVSFTAQQQSILLLPGDKGVFHHKENMLGLQPHDIALQIADVTWMNENSYGGNSIYEEEKRHPVSYIHHTFQWHSNLINQTVIEGEVASSAKVCAYDRLHMKATYISENNKVMDYRFAVIGQLGPGDRLMYKKRLPDWFKDTKEVRIVMEKVEVAKN